MKCNFRLIAIIILMAAVMSVKANYAFADCWGKVTYVYANPSGGIDAGIAPLPNVICQCQLKTSGAIGYGSLVFNVPSSAVNKKELYAALLLATSNGTSVYIPSTTCTLPGVISYTQ